MNLQFDCPSCGLTMQASADTSNSTAQCPQCGQEFMVEASRPVMPVVKAQAIPAAVPHPAPPLHRPPHTRPAPASQSRVRTAVLPTHPHPGCATTACWNWQT